jgi:hypothetical protein
VINSRISASISSVLLELLLDRLNWRFKIQPCCVSRRMSRENPTWGLPRIVSELALLGHKVCEVTVLKCMVRNSKPTSQRWHVFPANHMFQYESATSVP